MSKVFDPLLSRDTAETISAAERLQDKLNALLKDKLEKVEAILRDSLTAEGLMRDLTDYILAGRGKRLRPALLLLCGKFGAVEEEYTLVRAAAAVELIHTASLIHDDVIDVSAARRGRPSLNSICGNRTAVLVGDFFFARAFELVACCGDFELNKLLTGAISSMCAGEIEQARFAFDPMISEEEYLANIYRKTAVLLETSCGVGARLAALDETEIDKLEAFGRYLGLAYQITDDILDITGEPSVTGKPVGNDLREGNITLPFIYILKDPRWGPVLKKVIERRDFSPETLEFLREPSCNTVPLETARARALRFIEQGLQQLAGLKDIPAKGVLQELAASIPRRTS